MTDFRKLYDKFQFNENEAEQLKELYLLANGLNEDQKTFTIKTIISDEANETMVESEVKNGKLV